MADRFVTPDGSDARSIPAISAQESAVTEENLIALNVSSFEVDSCDNPRVIGMNKEDQGRAVEKPFVEPSTADENTVGREPLFLQPLKQVFCTTVRFAHQVTPYKLEYFWLNEQELAACDEDIVSITETVYVEEMEWDLYCEEDKVEDARQFWNGIRTLFAKIGEYVKVLTLRLVESSYLPAEVEDIKTGLICRGIYESCPNLTALKLCGTWTTGYHDDVSEEEDRGPLSLMNLDVLVVHRKADGLSLVKALENVVDNVRHLSLFDTTFILYMKDCHPLSKLEKLTLGCLGSETCNPHDVLPLFAKCPNLRFLDLQTACKRYIREYADFINTIISLTKLEELTTDDSVRGFNSMDNNDQRIIGLQRAVFNLTTFDDDKAQMMELYAEVGSIRIVTCSFGNNTTSPAEMKRAVEQRVSRLTNISFE